MSEKRTKHRISGEKQKKLRVAAYCRVSTLMDAQDTSFELQCEHYRGYITGREDYELVGVYGDHGKSGRKMDGRPELGRLLADCEAGRIDLILTKSIARFSRNMRECVSTIRRLQALGVKVFFEKEGIDTSEPRNELLFHLMATIAEEESNSIGRNLMTAHEMRNRSGNPFWQRKYGYKKGANGEWIPDERPAEKVRSAFCMACAGYSVGSIRRMLIRMEGCGPKREKVVRGGRFHAAAERPVQGRLPDAEDHPKRRRDGPDEESRRAGAVLPGGASYAAGSSGGVRPRSKAAGIEDPVGESKERFTRTAGAAGGRKAAVRGIRAVRRHPGQSVC